jgi:hypothetical protein
MEVAKWVGEDGLWGAFPFCEAPAAGVGAAREGAAGEVERDGSGGEGMAAIASGEATVAMIPLAGTRRRYGRRAFFRESKKAVSPPAWMDNNQ